MVVIFLTVGFVPISEAVQSVSDVVVGRVLGVLLG